MLECAVVAIPDEKWGERPKAFVTLKPGGAATEGEIVDFCRERLAHFKCPARGRVRRLAEDLDREDPEARAARARVGRQGEADRLMASTERPYRSELTPGAFLRRSAAVFPERTAVVYEGRRVAYRELAERAERLAGALAGAGLEPGDRVAVLCPNTPAMLEATFAVPAAGLVLVPINVRLSAGEIAWILDHSGARLAIVDHELAHLVEDHPELGRRRSRPAREGRTIHTSGSRAPGRAGTSSPPGGRGASRSTTPRARQGGRRASWSRTGART